MIAVGNLTDLSDKLGIIDAVKGKLLRQPDSAAEKLFVVLEEISKVYTALDTEISKFLSTFFDNSQTSDQRQDERRTLIELEGGEIVARMSKASGHCKKIQNIYSKYLSTWFDKVLALDEREKMESLFLELDELDGDMMRAFGQVADWLSNEAHETLELIEATPPRIDDANKRIHRARRTIFEDRRNISQAMRTLFDLHAELIAASGAV